MAKKPEFIIGKVAGRQRPWRLHVPADYSETGEKRRLFFATEREAKAEKSRREILLMNGGIEAARLTPKQAKAMVTAEKLLGGTNVVDAATSYRQAIDTLAPYGVDLTEAVRFFTACHSPGQSKSFDDLAAEYRQLKASKRPKYRRDIERVLARFETALQAVFVDRGIEGLPMRAINPEIAKEALDSLELTIHDFNLHRRTLNPFFNWAVQNEWIDENPLKTIPNRETPHREILVLSNTQVAALIDSCDESTLPFFALAIFAGIRPEEINKLKVANFNFKGGYITVAATVSKTHRKRFAEIPENLASLLSRYPLRDPGLSRSKVDRVRRKAEALLQDQGQAKEAATLKAWGHSIMRHTFASNHYAYHKDSERLIRCMGHVELETTASHYLNVIDPDDAREFWTIGLPEGENALKLVS